MNDTTTTVLDAAANPKRRTLLYKLYEADGSPVEKPTGVSMQHLHLPKLQDTGLIEVANGAVYRGPAWDTAEDVIAKLYQSELS